MYREGDEPLPATTGYDRAIHAAIESVKTKGLKP